MFRVLLTCFAYIFDCFILFAFYFVYIYCLHFYLLFISYSCTSFFAWCTYRVSCSCSSIVDICCCQSCISWMHSAAFCAWSLKWASDAVNDAEAFELADLARACTTKARVFLQWWIIIFYFTQSIYLQLFFIIYVFLQQVTQASWAVCNFIMSASVTLGRSSSAACADSCQVWKNSMYINTKI